MGGFALCLADFRIFSELPHYDQVFLPPGLEFPNVHLSALTWPSFIETTFYFIGTSPLGLSCFLFDTKTHL
jgi:hypothetical protein